MVYITSGKAWHRLANKESGYELDEATTGQEDSVTDIEADALKPQHAEQRYTEICNNIRALDQNSFHLLQFVPLVTTAAILGLSFLNIPFAALWLISWVGAAVTFGLYRWEMRNIQICRWLQERADIIERDEFHAPGMMQFAFRTNIQREGIPPSFHDTDLNDLDTQKIFGWTVKFRGKPIRITQRVAERIIYGATIFAWLAMPLAVWLSRRN